MKKITEKLYVSGQPDRSGLEEAKARGVVRIIDSRPAGETGDRPFGDGQAEAVRALGLDYRAIPMAPGAFTEDRARRFQRSLAEADGPVLAHCRQGGRALALYAIGEVLDGRMTPGDLDRFGATHGIDLSAAKAWLERRAAAPARPEVTGFFDRRTFSIQYVVADPATRRCAIVDPVLDFDPKSGAVRTANADRILAFVAEKGLEVEWILDTHPHADHFSAAPYLKSRAGGKTAIGERIVDVQAIWKAIYNRPDFPADGSQWDRTFAAGETFRVGEIEARVLFSPGHTAASVTYVVGDAAFVHDTLFMPDGGTARADFPGGDAARLWHSIREILALAGETRLFTGHDYQPGGREPLWESTVAEQKAHNIHVADGVTEADFVARRQARDRTLPMPALILHALQVNIDGGRLPAPEANGRRYLKFPLDALPDAAWEGDA